MKPAPPSFSVKTGHGDAPQRAHDPGWASGGLPAADPAKVAMDLKNLPVNQWVLRPTPKLPGRTWIGQRPLCAGIDSHYAVFPATFRLQRTAAPGLRRQN